MEMVVAVVTVAMLVVAVIIMVRVGAAATPEMTMFRVN